VEDFATYTINNVADPAERELLVTVDRAGNMRGNFWFALHSKAMLFIRESRFLGFLDFQYAT
jgi:hypothetical protein